jgi:hypothetical protein
MTNLRHEITIGKTGVQNVTFPDGFLPGKASIQDFMHDFFTQKVAEQIRLGNDKPVIYADGRPGAINSAQKRLEAVFAPTTLIQKAVRDAVMMMQQYSKSYSRLSLGGVASKTVVLLNGRRVSEGEIGRVGARDDIRITSEAEYFRNLEGPGSWAAGKALNSRVKKVNRRIRGSYVKQLAITDLIARVLRTRYRSLYVGDVWIENYNRALNNPNKRWPAIKIGIKF